MADLKTLMVATLKEQIATDKPIRVPAGGAMLWTWFNELSRTRSMHAAGPNPISFEDLAAYVTLRQLEIGQHHIDILLAMDVAYLDHVRVTSAPPPDGAKVMPPVSRRAISAGLFDAMMG